jgi:hypothetical protein
MNTEREVIIQTRLGILCGNGTPTPEQIAIAEAEADAWEASQLDDETQAALQRIQVKARERRRDYAMSKRTMRQPHNSD